MLKRATIVVLLLMSMAGIARGNATNADSLGRALSVQDTAASVALQEGDPTNETLNTTLLFNAVENWLGTPYRYGGRSKRGTCCSGFVASLFEEIYELDITGSSRDQFTRVIPVTKGDLKEGDLVFFNIHSRSISHVGVYLGSNKFAHATIHNGVIISDLNEPYYKRYFYRAGRVKELVFETRID